MPETKNYILNADVAAKKLLRMAFEIAEQHVDETEELILVGIKDNGVVMARIIAEHLAKIFLGKVKVIELSLDKRNPGEIQLSESLNFNDTNIIIVDDVTNSGKTLLYALKPFLQYHPRRIETLTLIERSHKTYPVNSDYVGIPLSTTLQEHIFVEVENGAITGAYLV
ncbi:MAG: phosphoribosyltransferase [Chitinophagaceae bacterium]|nr:phosphoribosyltransferase [Chitinophagaceae bacterium]